MKPGELHKVHAAHDRKAKSLRVDVGDVAWRGESGAHAVKAAMALRLAVCWNVCEGIQTDKLEAGVLLDYYVAVDRLIAAVDEPQGRLFHSAEKVLELMRLAARVKEAQRRIGVEHFECLACDAKKETA